MGESFDSILLLGFGGPTEPGHSVEFVRRVVGGRGASEDRILEVARHYDELGGVSPYNARTFELRDALAEALAGRDLPIAVGLRFWEPLVRDALAELQAAGRRRSLAVILSAFQSPASWEVYQKAVAEACARPGCDQVQVEYLDPFWDSEGFQEANADAIRRAVETQLGPGDEAIPIFTAHSIPVSVAAGSPYAQQFALCAAAIARRLGRDRYTLAYQSAASGGRVPWLGPDVGEAIDRVHGEGFRRVVVCPVGFLCDHVEVLYDLDIVARRRAGEKGVAMARARTAESHPAFVSGLADRIGARLESSR